MERNDATDGWITVGTKLDTKDLEKDIRSAENKLRQYEKESEKLTQQRAKINIDLNAYEEEKKKIQESTDLTLKKAQTEEQVNWVLDQENMELESLNLKYAETFRKNEDITKSISENKNQQKFLNNEIQEMNSQLRKSKGFDYIKNSTDDISGKMSNIIKKASRWLLAIFSISGAYMMVRSAMNTLTQYNEQLAVNIEYLQYALAKVLEPIIENIINLIYKILAYINYIAQAWFNVNLFANASANSFTKAKENSEGVAKNTGAAAKNAKKLRKELAGFDEMNVLGSNVEQAGSGGNGGGKLDIPSIPSFDLANLKNVPIPEWIKWIAENGKTVAIILSSIAAAIAGFKVAGFLANVAGLTSGLGSLKIGAALAMSGIVLLIGEIINLILHWDEMSTKEKIISIALAALGAAFIALGTSIATGISIATLGIGALIAAVTSIIGVIAGLILKEKEDAKQTLDTTETKKQLKRAQDDLKKSTNDYISAVDDEEATLASLREAEKKTGLSGKKLQEQVDAGKLTYKEMNAAQREVYKAYKEHENAQDVLSAATKKLNEDTKESEKAAEKDKLARQLQAGEYDKLKKSVVEAMNQGKISTKEAVTYIDDAMKKMTETQKKSFAKDLPDSIKKSLKWQEYKPYANQFSKEWNSFVKKQNKTITLDVVTNYSSKGSKPTSKHANGAVVKLASGAIINQPGRGVPLSRAIAGERGAEGIIPLTNSQMMTELGATIGKYININLTNITKLDNRQIAKEQKRINAQNDFAFNR